MMSVRYIENSVLHCVPTSKMTYKPVDYVRLFCHQSLSVGLLAGLQVSTCNGIFIHSFIKELV